MIELNRVIFFVSAIGLTVSCSSASTTPAQSLGNDGPVESGASSLDGNANPLATPAGPVDATDAAAPDGGSDPAVSDATMQSRPASAEASAADGAAPDAAALPFKGVALYESNTCGDLQTLGLSWYYNWTPHTSCSTRAEFVPHIWGHPSEAIASEIAQIVAAGHREVLGFNEPDNPSQSNMTVAHAIALWPTLEHAGLRLGSPATQANTTGQAWFQQFMTLASQQNLRVDFVALHWYGWNAGSCADARALESYVQWAEQWSRPIWITEWACLNLSAPSAQTVKTFYDDAIAMFKRHPLIERYGWFLSRASDNNALIVSTTSALSPLGIDYASAPSLKP